MNNEAPSLKVILYVFSLYSTVMLGLVAYIALTGVETSIAVSGIHTEMTIQIPRILAQQEKFRSQIDKNSAEIIKLNTAKYPYLEGVVQRHIDGHQPEEPKRRTWDSSSIMSNNKDLRKEKL